MLFALCNLNAPLNAFKVENRPRSADGSLHLFQFVFLSPFSPSRSTFVHLRVENGDSASASARLTAIAGAIWFLECYNHCRAKRGTAFDRSRGNITFCGG